MKFWPLAVLHANFVLNVYGTSGNEKDWYMQLGFTEDQSEEKLNCLKNKLKVFGCRCVGHNPPELVRKEQRFAPTGVEGIFVGLQPGSYEFKILTREGKIHLTRH